MSAIRFSAVLLLCVNAGCVSTTISDLSFKSASIVREDQQPELADRKVIRPETPYLNLKVEFTSDIDLVKYREENTTSMGGSAWICDSKLDRELSRIDGWGIYFRGQEITQRLLSGTQSLPEKPPFTYYIFLNINGRAGRGAIHGTPLPGYDLRQVSSDICYDIRGAKSAMLFGYKSNVLRVPEAVLKSALEHYRSANPINP
ncbi:MAG TPA: hypothetical protein VFS04_01735 [Alphaproteobacteria bacterium]|nr:hypothetical protein [Alphaproteobacteria bacterium]